MKTHRPKIAVVGSLNVDFTFRLQRIPKPGETLTAKGMEVHFGGKGANQAIAAARAGAEVSLIGCVGNDEHGSRYRAHLEKEGIQTDMLFTSAAPTGCAFIAVDERGENSIVVHPGANAELSLEHLNQFAAAVSNMDAVLLQLECPLPVVAHAIKLAKAAGVRVIVNPSPFLAEAVHTLKEVDVWILNQSEFLQWKKATARNESLACDAVEAQPADSLLVVTDGAHATVLISKHGKIVSQPPRVEPVDTVGAGDTFAGAFAVALSESRPLDECVRFANVAGALATLQLGAQSSIPERKLVEQMLQEVYHIPLFSDFLSGKF